MAKRGYRKIEKNCILCHKIPTRDWSYVCTKCRQHRRDGALLEKQQSAQEGAREHYAVRWYTNLVGWAEDKPFAFGEGEGEMLLALLKTLGQSPRYPKGSRRPSIRTLGDRRGDSGSGSHPLFLTADQAEAFEGVIFLCRRLWRTAYLKGKDEGGGILHRMATGEIKPADFSEYEEARAKSVQKRGIDNGNT